MKREFIYYSMIQYTNKTHTHTYTRYGKMKAVWRKFKAILFPENQDDLKTSQTEDSIIVIF